MINSKFWALHLLPCIGFLWFAPNASLYAHKVASASVVLEVTTDNERSFKVSAAMEVESSGDARIDDEIGPEDAAKAFVENNLQVLVDELEQPLNLTSELINVTDDETPVELRRLSVVVNWTGALPESGKELALFLKETSEMSIVLRTIKNRILARRTQVMFPGEYSRYENIQPILEGNPFDSAAAIADPTDLGGDAKPKSGSAVTSESGSRGRSRTMNACFSGIKTMFLWSGFPAAFVLIALLSLGRDPRRVSRWVVGMILCFIIGFALAGFVNINLSQISVWIVSAILIALSICLLINKDLGRLGPVVITVGAFFLGSSIVSASSVLEIGRPPLPVGQSMAFLLGVVLVVALLFAVVVVIFKVRFSELNYQNFVRYPIGIIAAGIALFMLLEQINNSALPKRVPVESRRE